MRIANVENSAFNWGSISSAGAPDMTHCDFSVKSARDEMTSLEAVSLMSSLGLTGIRTGEKDKDHIECVRELYEAQVARGRYFVHELTSEVNSRVRYVAKVMAMPGIRTVVADLCMFGLAACDEGGPRFVNVSVRTITNARRVGARLQSKCGSMLEARERTGSWFRQAVEEHELELFSVWEGVATGSTTKADGLIPRCVRLGKT